MSFSSSNQQTAQSAVLLSCGAVLTAGLWWAASSAGSTSSAYVKTQPTAELQIGVLPVRSVRHLQQATPQQLEKSATASTSTALGAAPMLVGAFAAAAPWLSIVAILVSIASAVKKYFQPQALPALPVPAYGAYAPEPYYADTPRRSDRMDEVAQSVTAELASRKQLTPKSVILELQRGNARFWSGTPERPESTAMERRALIIAQAPTVCILSCSDSRVPVELLFDQGLGSVFVVRVAGNILDSSAMGSIEFAVKYLGVKVLMVMGHEGCGAVKGAMSMSKDDIDAQPTHLQAVLRNIKSNLNLSQLSNIRDSRAQDREAIVVNATSQVKKLKENKLISDRVNDGSLLVCGAFYEITSGIVDFFSLDKNGLVVDI